MPAGQEKLNTSIRIPNYLQPYVLDILPVEDVPRVHNSMQSSFMEASELKQRCMPGGPQWFEVKFHPLDQPRLGQHYVDMAVSKCKF